MFQILYNTGSSKWVKHLYFFYFWYHRSVFHYTGGCDQPAWSHQSACRHTCDHNTGSYEWVKAHQQASWSHQSACWHTCDHTSSEKPVTHDLPKVNTESSTLVVVPEDSCVTLAPVNLAGDEDRTYWEVLLYKKGLIIPKFVKLIATLQQKTNHVELINKSRKDRTSEWRLLIQRRSTGEQTINYPLKEKEIIVMMSR